MNKRIKKLISKRSLRRKSQEPDLDGRLPRITNETVAAHREEIISGAKKYIYPLRHSKNRVVMISTVLITLAVVVFLSYVTIALYRLQETSTFIYRVTEVIPFPIARSGRSFVAYENYLFEVRHYMHFYQNQQKLSFESPEGKAQLDAFRRRALQKVVDTALVKQLASENKISISEQEVDQEIAIVKSQNRLGSDDKIFEDVLRDYWGWDVSDFRRSLKEQLLAQKLAATLDPESAARAQAALVRLKSGADFGAVAREVSEDELTNQKGGEFAGLIERASRDIPAEVTEALFALQPGQYSAVVNAGSTLEIVKLIELSGSKAKAAHISFKIKDITEAINDRKEKQKVRLYIDSPPAVAELTQQP